MAAFGHELQALLRLPGATYSCVVERDTGRVLGEAGNAQVGAGDSEGVVPFSVARWGTGVAAMFDTTSGDELVDVMITGRRSYHLVRSLGATAEVLVYLRLDRARSNLAVARRELAAVRWPEGDDAGPHGPVPGGPVPGGGAPVRPARAVPAPPAALAPPAARAATPRGGAAPPNPPAPRSTAEGEVPRIPLPRRSPGAARDRSPDPNGPFGAVPERLGAPPPDAATGPGAGRGARERASGGVIPAVLGQVWAQDPGTLRRLLIGLRRMA